jgi:peptidoglycan/xylan/chitin deacetylase (PgdA/CDA1 family)
MKLSISVDDGHPLDLKVAEILAAKGIPTTFYIPLNNIEGKPVLTKKQIKTISRDFEVGCHTYNHNDLTKVSLKVARREIKTAKDELENIVGGRISSFAPPKGYYNKAIVKIAKALGFKDFRSARIINFREPDKSKFVWHPNLHLYPHSLTTELLHLIKRQDYFSLIERIKRADKSHLELIKEFKKYPTDIHFWLHSWEIEEMNLWNLLKRL